MSGNGAGDGIRTRDIQLGRLTLYQTELLPLGHAHGKGGGGGRIRTFEGISRQIYSLLPLAARAPHQLDRGSLYCACRRDKKSWRRDSNPQPPHYK